MGAWRNGSGCIKEWECGKEEWDIGEWEWGMEDWIMGTWENRNGRMTDEVAV